MTHHHHHDHEGHHHPQHRKRIHTDWRLWAVVVLMLGAMLAYVLSNDESIQPGQAKPEQPVPAAPAL